MTRRSGRRINDPVVIPLYLLLSEFYSFSDIKLPCRRNKTASAVISGQFSLVMNVAAFGGGSLAVAIKPLRSSVGHLPS